MVLPIGFFAPLPLPMMIPFMGIQSAVMAEQFGTLFQYGKRRISAMSNEEFNKLTPEMLQERMTKQIEGMIPEMERQIKAMSVLVPIIIREFGAYLSLATKEIAGLGDEGPLLAGTGSVIGDELAHLVGKHVGHGPVQGPTRPIQIPVPVIPKVTASQRKEAEKRRSQRAIARLLANLNTYSAAVQANRNAGRDATHNQKTVDSILRQLKNAQVKYKAAYGTYFG